MNTQKKPRTVIVTGAKRSGTTLLERLLDDVEHSFNFLDELFFFEYLYDVGPENAARFIDFHNRAATPDLIDSVKRRQLFLFFEDGYSQGPGTVNKQNVPVRFEMKRLTEELEAGRSRGPCTSIEQIWDLWVRAFCKGMFYDYDQILTVLMKSPDYGKSALAGFDYLEDPRVIYLVRNPLHSIDSLKKSREMRALKLHLFELLNVLRDYDLLVRTLEGLSSDAERKSKVFVLRYEDFLQAPEPSMRKIADFMGLPFSERFLRPTMNGQDWYGLSSFDMLNGISDAPLNRGIQVLSSWEADLVLDHIPHVFRYFDYPLRVPGK